MDKKTSGQKEEKWTSILGHGWTLAVEAWNMGSGEL